PVTAADQPFLAVNEMRYSRRTDESGRVIVSGDWNSVKIFDLRTLALWKTIEQSALNSPITSAGLWISSLVSLSNAELFVTAGIQKEAASTYYLASISLDSLVLNLITQLGGAFL